MSIINILPDITGGVKAKPAAPPVQPSQPSVIWNKQPSPTAAPQQSIMFTGKTGGGSSRKSTPTTPIFSYEAQPPVYPVTSPNKITAPEYYSPQAGWQRVKDIFTFNYTGDTLAIFGQPTNKAISGTLKTVTGIAEVGTLAWAGSLLFPSAAGTGAATTAATAGTGLFGAARTAIFAGTAGLIGGGLLFGGKTTQSQDQNTTTTTTTTTYQTTNTSQDTYNTQYVINSPNAAPQLFGNPSQNVAPSQSVTPSVDVNPTQSQAAGTDFALIALIAAGAFILSRGK